MTAPQDATQHQGLAPSTRTLLSLAAAVIVLAGVYVARGSSARWPSLRSL
ncbi:hypothetical protein NKG05_10130 [Oerskovia sp. M15]